MKNSPRFKSSVDTDSLVRVMKEIKMGETITYSEMSNVIGRNVLARRWTITSAINKLRNEYGIVFEVISKVGYKRLDSIGIVQTGSLAIKKIRSAAKVGMKKLSCVDFQSLDVQKQVEHNAKYTVLALVQESTTKKSISKIENKVGNSNDIIPAAKAAVYALDIVG